MSDVTQLLTAIDRGDPLAADQLLPLVYDELRRLAAAKMSDERPDQTLQATALVHEAFVRLLDVENAQQWSSRGHFFAAAAEAMRRILVENARRRLRLKHGAAFRDCSRQHQPTFNPHRRAAEYVLSIGGTIRINVNGQEHL